MSSRQASHDALGLVVLLVERAVADLDGVGAAGDLDDRGVVEVAGEPLGVDGGAGDDDLEVGALGQELLQIAEDEVDVEAALVRLVDDQRVVLLQQPVGLQLGQQDAVGHQLDQRAVARLVVEADLVADGLAELGAELLGDALGHGAGGDAARLGVADQAADATAELQADLGDLGGLAGPGLTGDDHDLVVADRREDVVAPLGDGQVLRIGHRGHAGPAAGQPPLGPFDVGEDLRGDLLPRLAGAHPAHAVEPAPQSPLVARHQVGQAGMEVGERRGQRRSSHTAFRIFEPRVPGANDPSCLSAAAGRIPISDRDRSRRAHSPQSCVLGDHGHLMRHRAMPSGCLRPALF